MFCHRASDASHTGAAQKPAKQALLPAKQAENDFARHG
jgi:hypothetical protein